MKIVTWNCNLNFAKKYEHIESMDVDVCIVQECERLNEDYFPNSRFFWTGRIENKGLGYSLNKGVTESSNEIVFRMDTDDIMKAERITTQITYLKENPSCALCGSQVEMFPDNDINKIMSVTRHVNITWAEYKKNKRMQNNHWTLRTIVWVGKKFSLVTIKLYNEKGKIIGSGSKRVNGTINWKPRWKLTRIKEQGPFGAASKEIFEQWPPLMEEVPPLITDYTVGQALFGAYEIDLQGCTTNYCLEKQGLK